uniref:translation initiation factor IF-2 associated domain-containing protein n=1 Tax=Aureimonas sp. AU4 TaxID=1638163 RepID=UPI000A483A51
MSDTKSGDDKTLSVTPKKTLSLKPGGAQTQSTVRQNFSHGRTKNVVVETKKRKFSLPGEGAKEPAPTPAAPAAAAPRPTLTPAQQAALQRAAENPQAPPPADRIPERAEAAATPAAEAPAVSAPEAKAPAEPAPAPVVEA